MLRERPLPRSKLQTAVSGAAGVAALNSWHHCGFHVTDPVALEETPLQPCALALSALKKTIVAIARRHLQSKCESTRIVIWLFLLSNAAPRIAWRLKKTDFLHG